MQVQIKVIPKAKRIKIEKQESFYKVYLTAPAVDNKANYQLIEVLAEFFDVAKREIVILKGHKSRQKVVRIGG